MALIKCSECNKDVSDKAPFCPNCGAPIKPADDTTVGVATSSDKPVQIEPVLVSKNWKRVKLIGWGIIIFGFLLFGSSGGQPWSLNNLGFWAGFDFIFIGFITLIVGHIGAWYTDKRAR